MNNADRTIRENPAIGRSWEELRDEIFTPEEIAESNLRVALMGERIKAQQKKEVCHKEQENNP